MGKIKNRKTYQCNRIQMQKQKYNISKKELFDKPIENKEKLVIMKAQNEQISHKKQQQ